MAKKKTKELLIDTTPRRVKDIEIDVSYEMPCSNKIIELIKYLETLVIKYGEDASINIEESYDEYNSHFQAYVITFRDETPKEVEKRIAKAKKDKERAMVQRIKQKEKRVEQKIRQEQEELGMLEKLQNKYKGYNIQDIKKGD